MEFNGTFLISAISFVVFVFIMNVIFYKPIEKIVKERDAFIDSNFDEAKTNNLNSQKLIDEREKKITEANSKGKGIMEEKTNEAKIIKASRINEAQKKVSSEIHNNQSELKMAFEAAKADLSSQVENLANEMEEKLFE